jgi:hypothetical protein
MQESRSLFGQRTFAQAVTQAPAVPRARPSVDPELEECFTRAAVAWARWRERQRWTGRAA